LNLEAKRDNSKSWSFGPPPAINPQQIGVKSRWVAPLVHFVHFRIRWPGTQIQNQTQTHTGQTFLTRLRACESLCGRVCVCGCVCCGCPKCPECPGGHMRAFKLSNNTTPERTSLLNKSKLSADKKETTSKEVIIANYTHNHSKARSQKAEKRVKNNRRTHTQRTKRGKSGTLKQLSSLPLLKMPTPSPLSLPYEFIRNSRVKLSDFSTLDSTQLDSSRHSTSSID